MTASDDQFGGALARFVRWVMRGTDYHAAYPARVVTQHGDGTLDVVPDGARLPPLSRVPIRYGIPGVAAKVRSGARVLVEFASGDPEKPIATVWESASLTEVTITADSVRLADGDMPLARKGDLVAVAMPLLIGSTKYAPIGTDPTVTAFGTIVSGSSSSRTK